MGQIDWLAVALSALKLLTIPLGVFLLQFAVRKLIYHNLLVGVKANERFDRVFTLGIPEIGGFALCFVGFALQFVVATSAPRVIDVSHMYQLWGVVCTSLLMLGLGVVTLVMGILFSQRILTVELGNRKKVLDGIASGRRLQSQLRSSLSLRWRVCVACLGVVSLFLPIYTVFGNFLRGG